MANRLEDNIFIIDTVPVTLFSATERARISKIRWVGATNAGHVATIQNLAATPATLWEDNANSTDYTSESTEPFDFRDGVAVTALGSGILYLYLE